MAIPQRKSDSRERCPAIGDVNWRESSKKQREAGNNRHQRAPAKGKDERKTEVLNLRVTPEEKEMIRGVADHLGLTAAQYITQLILPLSRRIMEEQIFVASDEEFDDLVKEESLDPDVRKRWDRAPTIR